MTGVEKVSAALENHTVILSPTPIVTKAVVTIQREETGLRHPMCREVIQATKSTKKYVKDPVEIHNIKQRDEETIEDFMKRFKIETGRMKGALECMWIFGFMHGINNLELTKRLNEHVPKTMEEMKITTTTFIRGEVVAASKKTGYVSRKPQDQSKKLQIKGLIFEVTQGMEGQLRLLVTIGDDTHSTKAWMNFMVVKSWSPYNGIIGRPGLKAIQALPSTVHGILKFPTEGGIVTICSSLLIPAQCTSIGTSSVTPREERTRPANFTVALLPNFSDQEVVVGGSLSDRGRTELCSFLKKNLDICAWQPSDMNGVPRSVAEHRLNIREGCPPVRQKKRGQAPKHAKAIQGKVQKLVEARIMREVYYHDWLSNPVMEKKHDGSWRMCFDFTNLNKAYPYKGYHQIQLAEVNEEKTTFHTGQGVYCYTKMPFGLKNTGATYQRLMEKAFEGQVGRNIEVYIDDLVVKSHTEAKMVMSHPDAAGRLQKWSIMLGEHNITYRPRMSVKGQILADFLTEMSGDASQAIRATTS
nr:reverse transcriptase domain-containing protein [Tanacetum cinerariifolium]